jgi:hypothetical protein
LLPDHPVSQLPRGVTVAQAILDRFVMVRIHARQPIQVQGLMKNHPLQARTAYALLARFPLQLSLNIYFSGLLNLI